MFTKKRFLQAAFLILVFLLCDAWIYFKLDSSFSSYVEERNFNEIELFTRTFEEDADEREIDVWLRSVRDMISGARSSYLVFDYDLYDFVYETGSAALEKVFSENIGTREFQYAMESLYYLEPIRLSSFYTVDYSLDPDSKVDSEENSVIYFVPILNDEGWEAVAAVMIAVPDLSSSNFQSLLRVLLIAAALIFSVVVIIIFLTRDPMTGFLVLALFLIVGIFVAFPLFEAVRLSFVRYGEFSLAVWKRAISNDYLRALKGSLKLGVFTATVSTVIGFLYAFLIERTSFKRKKLMSTLATMPVISPPFSLSLSIILLFGNNGLITKQILHLNSSLYGLNGLVLVQTIGMFPIAFMTISGVLKQIDSTVEEVSLDLSATRMQTFLKITLPLALPGILSAWLLVFTNSLADFANPLLLAGDYHVLSVEAYTVVTGSMNDLGMGSALSFLLLLPTLTAFLAQRFWISRKSYVTVTGKPNTNLTELTGRKTRTALLIICAAIMAFIVSLYLTIFAGCFVKNWGIDYTFTLSNWSEAISRGYSSIRDTFILAIIATPIAGLLAMIAAMLIVRKKFPGKRLLEMLIMTPYAIPGTLIGISYILAFNKEPILLVGTGAIIVINYVIRELPVGLENGVTALKQIDGAIEESASDLGADVTTVFRTIVLPLVRPAYISSMSYTFVRSMTAVSAIIFLISARWNHLTVLIFNFSENLRFGLASVLATILIIIVLLVFFLMNVLVKDSKLTQKTISGR